MTETAIARRAHAGAFNLTKEHPEHGRDVSTITRGTLQAMYPEVFEYLLEAGTLVVGRWTLTIEKYGEDAR